METLVQTPVTCRNCGTALDQEYCPACGQRKPERLTFRNVWADFVHIYLSSDAGIFFTTGQLIRRPGHMVREYLNGKRKPYTKPLQFFLIMLTVYILLSEWLGVDPMESGRMMNQNMGLNGAAGTEAQQSQEQTYQFFSENVRLFFILLLPPMTAALWLLYRKNRYTFTELLILGLYVFGMSFLMLAFQTIVFALKPPLLVVHAIIYGVMVISLIYSVWALYQFFPQRGLSAIGKITVAYVLGFIIYMLLTIVGVTVYLLFRMYAK